MKQETIETYRIIYEQNGIRFATFIHATSLSMAKRTARLFAEEYGCKIIKATKRIQNDGLPIKPFGRYMEEPNHD